MSQPPFPMQLLCLPSSFPMCLLFPLFILPVLLSLCMPLTLFPFRYLVTIIFIQLVQLVPINLVQLVPINLCFLSGSPAPLLLFFPGFYLLMPVFFYPITNILSLMPPLPRFLFPFPLSLLFPF